MIKDKDIRYKYIRDNAEFFESGMFLNEYGINGTNIVDFACLKDNIFYGYEIKSEVDNTNRLINQLKSYVGFFDCVKLIVHVKHQDKVTSILKRYNLSNVGLIVVNPDMTFTEVIDCKILKNNFRLGHLIKNISKDNLIKVARSKNIQFKKNSKYNLVNLMVGKITLSEVLDILKGQFKERINRCSLCNSTLTINTSDTISHFEFMNKVEVDKKLVHRLKYKCVYKRKVCKCIKCNKVFKVLSSEKLNSDVLSIKTKRL